MTTSQQSIAKKGPLDGFKVIKFSSKGPAPLCAMLLGDTNARRECGCTTTRGKLVHLSSAMDRWKRNLGFKLQALRDPAATSRLAEWICAHDVSQVARG